MRIALCNEVIGDRDFAAQRALTRDRSRRRRIRGNRSVSACIMNGVTGRMGTNQHLVRSILAIRAAGRRRARPTGGAIMPDPILVGRNADKLAALAGRTASRAGRPISTRRSPTADDADLLRHAQSTGLRPQLDPQGDRRRQAHLHRKAGRADRGARPSSSTGAAQAAGVKHGVVQDKLWLPGLLKLKMLIDSGFFGRILSVRGEFGYWVFEGDCQPAQRPSWNYRKEDGGGIIVDMLCHWRYVLDNLFGEVKSVLLPRRHAHPASAGTRTGSRYDCTADDAAYATFELAAAA